MGIFSTNRYGSVDTDVVIEAAEGYHGEIGAAIAMIEGYQNDMALFNGIIMTDFQESALIHEGASAEEVYVLQEGALSGAWEKIKQFFKKLGEKIKGIFHAFIAKMDSVFMKDANAFYKKYIKDINQKKSWKDFKCKVKPVKVNTGEVALGFDDGNGVKSLSIQEGDKKALDNWDSEIEYEKVVAGYVSKLAGKGIQNSTEFKKEYMETIFDDEEVKDDWNSSDITGGYVGTFLKDKETLKTIEKANKETEKAIKNIIAAIEKEQSDLAKIDRTEYSKIVDGKSTVAGVKRTSSYTSDKEAKHVAGDGIVDRSEGSLDSYSVKVNLTHKKATVIQEVFNAYAAASVEAYKECCAQARRVFAAAVAFSPKNENAELAAAIGDVAYYEAVDLMDTMYSIAD